MTWKMAKLATTRKGNECPTLTNGISIQFCIRMLRLNILRVGGLLEGLAKSQTIELTLEHHNTMNNRLID